MAETTIKAEFDSFGTQNTGNPVLDSMVNVMANYKFSNVEYLLNSMDQIHAKLLELAVKEPGGLRYHKDTFGVEG